MDIYLFIDEIENAIHYTNYEKLWRIILEASEKANCQIFITTHSKECIESYARVAKKLEDKDISLKQKLDELYEILKIIDNCVFVLEFKIGSDIYDKSAKEQAFDYGLDLNNFHEGSHDKNLIPILIVAPHSLIKSIILISTAFANLVQCSVLPSPTPIVPIFLDLISVMSNAGKEVLRYRAAISPALPPPKMQSELIITSCPLFLS